MRVSVDELQDLTIRALRKSGYNDDETAKILDVVLYAQLRGNNQGVVKLAGDGMPRDPEAGEIEVEKETKLSALINGHKLHAMLVVNHATDMAIEKAKEYGIGLVGVHGINTSSGAVGYYARRIASEGMIGFVCGGSMETVAAHGSSQPIFGTNPLAFAVPTEEQPLVLDMATSAMAYFGVIEAMLAGRKLPERVAYDKDGKPTTDAEAALEGALLTFDQGGYKGSGLSMMVQILTGPLVGGSFTGTGDLAQNWAGHFVLAIGPELLGGLAELKRGVSQMITQVKATRKLPGVVEILVAGERGDRVAKTARTSGEVEIEDHLYSEFKKAAG